MVKQHNMASGENMISGSPSDYYTPTQGDQRIYYPELDKSGRGAGGPIMASMPTSGGTPAMRGATVNYPNSNNSGIRGSINDGATPKGGAAGVKVSPEAPQRHPVLGVNPGKPVQRKAKR